VGISPLSGLSPLQASHRGLQLGLPVPGPVPGLVPGAPPVRWRDAAGVGEPGSGWRLYGPPIGLEGPALLAMGTVPLGPPAMAPGLPRRRVRSRDAASRASEPNGSVESRVWPPIGRQNPVEKKNRCRDRATGAIENVFGERIHGWKPTSRARFAASLAGRAIDGSMLYKAVVAGNAGTPQIATQVNRRLTGPRSPGANSRWLIKRHRDDCARPRGSIAREISLPLHDLHVTEA
jgi:hypothetical protein